MSRWFVWTALCVCVGCQAQSTSASKPKTAPQDPAAVTQALKLAEDGRIADGLDLLHHAIEKSPNDGRLYGARATLHHRAGLNSLALADLDRALEASPDDPQLLNNRGFIRLSLRQHAGAIEDLERALELQPVMASACNNRGLVALAQGKYHDGVIWFSKALSADGEYVDAWNNRGFAWMQLNRLENAYADLNQALRISPKYVNALHNRGLVKARAGEREAAILDFTDAMMLDPKNPKYYQHRSEVYALLGQHDEARADARMMDWLVQLQGHNRLLAAEPRNARAWASRAQHYLEHGDEEQARQDAEKALEIDSNLGLALVLQARMAFAKKQYDEVLRLTAQALETDDASAAASIRGDACLALGKFNEALEHYAAARRFDSAVAEAYFRKSLVLSAQGDAEGAQVQLKQARELDPTVETRLR